MPVENFQLTIIVFYWFYLVVLAIFFLFFLINIYHLLRFGFFSVINLAVILTSIMIAFLLISFSLLILQQIDWSQTLINPEILNGFINGLLGGLNLFKFKIN